MDGAASLSTAVDDGDLDDGAGGGDVADAATALPARWKPDARARDVAGFARARWAAEKAAAAGIGDCISALSELEVVPPARARRSGLDVKYSSRRAKKRIFFVGREIGERHLQMREYVATERPMMSIYLLSVMKVANEPDRRKLTVEIMKRSSATLHNN